jgi:GntR family transcriptional regulator
MVVAMILEGTLAEGDALPSVRQVAADYRVNPLTVLKSFQQLVEDDLVEKRRGVGMFVKKGARHAALRDERNKFLSDEWPRILKLLERLGIDAEELLEKKRSHARPKTEGRTLKR